MDLPSTDRLENSDLGQELSSLETALTNEHNNTSREASLARYMATLRLVLANCLANGEETQAETKVLHALALFPDSEEAHEALIHLYMQTGRTEAAIQHWESRHDFVHLATDTVPYSNLPAPISSSNRLRRATYRIMSVSAIVGVTACIAANISAHRFRESSSPSHAQIKVALAPALLSPSRALEMALTAYNDLANYPEAERLCEVALSQSRSTGNSAGIAAALAQKGQAVEAQGDLGRAKRCYVEALELRKQRKEALSVAHLLEMLGGLAQSEGDYREADRELKESQAIRQQEGDLVGVALCLRDRGILAADQCRFTDATENYKESLHIIAPLNKPEIEVHVHALQGAVARNKGDFRQARALITKGLVFWQERKHPRWIADMKCELGITAFYEGNDGTATSLFDESLNGYRAVGDHSGVAEAQIWLARVLVHQGKTDKALLTLQDAMAFQQERQSPLLQTRTWEAQAEVLAKRDSKQAAVLRARAKLQRQKLHCPLSAMEQARLSPL